MSATQWCCVSGLNVLNNNTVFIKHIVKKQHWNSSTLISSSQTSLSGSGGCEAAHCTYINEKTLKKVPISTRFQLSSTSIKALSSLSHYSHSHLFSSPLFSIATSLKKFPPFSSPSPSFLSRHFHTSSQFYTVVHTWIDIPPFSGAALISTCAILWWFHLSNSHAQLTYVVPLAGWKWKMPFTLMLWP